MYYYKFPVRMYDIDLNQIKGNSIYKKLTFEEFNISYLEYLEGMLNRSGSRTWVDMNYRNTYIPREILLQAEKQLQFTKQYIIYEILDPSFKFDWQTIKY